MKDSSGWEITDYVTQRLNSNSASSEAFVSFQLPPVGDNNRWHIARIALATQLTNFPSESDSGSVCAAVAILEPGDAQPFWEGGQLADMPTVVDQFYSVPKSTSFPADNAAQVAMASKEYPDACLWVPEGNSLAVWYGFLPNTANGTPVTLTVEYLTLARSS